ncbi:MAG: DUF1461 domain-containing protein [Chloroflexota bacterium]
MRLLKVIGRWLFILAIPLFCLSLAISWEIATPAIYRYGFEKYDVAEASGITHEELNTIALKFPEYFNSADEFIDITVTRDGKPSPLFTEEELVHFRDVKDLIRLDRRILFISLGYILFYLAVSLLGRESRLNLSRAFITGSGLTLGLLLILAVGSTLDFSGLFLKFHELSFSNLYWSAPGYMTVLFPEGFWRDVAFLTMLVSSIFALGFGIPGYLWLRYMRRHER